MRSVKYVIRSQSQHQGKSRSERGCSLARPSRLDMRSRSRIGTGQRQGRGSTRKLLLLSFRLLPGRQHQFLHLPPLATPTLDSPNMLKKCVHTVSHDPRCHWDATLTAAALSPVRRDMPPDRGQVFSGPSSPRPWLPSSHSASPAVIKTSARARSTRSLVPSSTVRAF